MNYKGNFGQDPGQSTVVIQCQHDKQEILHRSTKKASKDNNLFWFYKQGAVALSDEASSRVDRGDMVFTVGTSDAPRASMSKAAVPVVSSISGLYCRKSTGDEKLVLDVDADEGVINSKLSRSLRFIGISLGATNPTPDVSSHEKTQITTRVRGTGKVFNNGNKTFVPGETVVWVLPDSSDIKDMEKYNRYGRSVKKITPMILPLRHHMNQTFSQNICQVFQAKNKHDFEKHVGYSPTNDFSIALKQLLVEAFLLGRNEGVSKPCPVSDVKKLSKEVLDQQTSTSSHSNVVQEIINQIFDLKTHGDVDAVHNNKNIRAKVEPLLLAFLQVNDDIKRRTIGTTIGYSAPGTDVSIIIGN